MSGVLAGGPAAVMLGTFEDKLAKGNFFFGISRPIY